MSDYLKNYLRHKIWYWNNKLFLRIKLQFASGDVFRCSLYSRRGLSMSQLSHDRLPFGQKFAFSSSHYTSGSHPWFALSVHVLPVRHFAVCSSQITKPQGLIFVKNFQAWTGPLPFHSLPAFLLSGPLPLPFPVLPFPVLPSLPSP